MPDLVEPVVEVVGLWLGAAVAVAATFGLAMTALRERARVPEQRRSPASGRPRQ